MSRSHSFRNRLGMALVLPVTLWVIAACGDGTGPEERPTHPSGTDVTDVPLSGNPFGLAISSRGTIYVSRHQLALVSRLDPGTGAVAQSIEVGNVPTGISFDRSGATAYVTNQASGSVSVINASTHAVLGDIPLANASPKVVIPSPSGAKVFISDGETGVRIASAATRQQTNSITVPFWVNGFAIGRGDVMLYASSVGGAVVEINLGTEGVARTFPLEGVPQEVVVSSDGERLFVANEVGWIDVIDLESGEVVDDVTMPAGAFGMALTPDGEILYVTIPSRGEIVLVDAATLEVVDTIDVGGTPRRVAFTRRGDLAVVTNEDGWVNFIR